METQKVIVSILILVLSSGNTAAQKIWENRKGCFRSQGNLAGGYVFQSKQVSAYLTGDMDLFVDQRAAITGSVWFSFATNRKNEPGIRVNHAVLGGMAWHFTKKGRWDPYINLTPGIGFVAANYREGDEIKRTSISPVPLLSASVGCNYYIGSIFHLFAKVQGISGQVLKDVPSTTRLEELRFSAGLGWNLRLWKPKV